MPSLPEYALRNAAEATEERAIARAMTNLASTIGDLETSLCALASRISPMLPAGSPFERAEKLAGSGGVGSVPAPVRSHHCAEIDARAYALRAMLQTVDEMVKSIEI